MYTTKAQICIRRDTAANFTSANPTLALGEIAYETDTRNIKVGNGSSAWTALPYINPFRGNAAADTTNTVLGSVAGASMQSGATYNTCIGSNAGNALTTADYNVFVGAQAGVAASTGSANVAVGYAAYQVGNGTSNTAVGMLSQLTATSGAANTSVGAGSLQSNLVGNNNVAVGANALVLNTSSDITAVGANALDANTTGASNVAVGKDALGANTTGGQNVAIGNSALAANTTGEANVAIGSLQTLSSCTSGTRNVAISPYALAQLTTGQHNVAIGEAAGYELLTSSSANTFLGHEAGRRIAAGTGNSASSNSIFIGPDTRAAANSQSNQIVIGYQAIGNGSNTTTIGNSSTTGTFIPAGNLTLTNGNFTAASSTGSANIGCQAAGGASLNLECGTSFNQIQSYNNNNALYITAGVADMYLRTATNQTRMTVGNDGNISIANGNLVMSTSGKGIDFSATANSSGTMTSELLSDYEEGTWTPAYSFASGTLGTVTYDGSTGGRYTKVGRQVTVTGQIATDAFDAGTASGAAFITGLPFTSDAAYRGAMCISRAINFVGPNNVPFGGWVNTGSTNIELQKRAASDGNTTALVIGDFAGNFNDHNYIWFTATYFV